MLKNTPNSFGSVSRTFHWLMSIMIICLLCVGFYMAELPNSPDKFELYKMHKSIGVIVLLLVVFRILWRFLNITPILPSTMPSWQVLGYKIGVIVMYILMLGMPISGVIMSRFGGREVAIFDWFTIPAALEKNEAISYLAWKLHGIGAWAFIAFVTLHASVAIYHHFITKDRLLMRMVSGE